MRKETLYIGNRSQIEEMCTTKHKSLALTPLNKQLDQIESTSNKMGIVFMQKAGTSAYRVDKWFVHLQSSKTIL